MYLNKFNMPYANIWLLERTMVCEYAHLVMNTSPRSNMCPWLAGATDSCGNSVGTLWPQPAVIY